MAYEAWGTGSYSIRSNYKLELYVRREATDQANNRSTYAWQLYAYHTPGSYSGTWDGTAFGWSVWVEGQNWTGSRGLDFRNGNPTNIIASGVTGWKSHNSDGYLTVDFSASHGHSSLFGTASLSGSFSADRIPRVPYAPPTATFVSATADKLNFTISAPSDNGGATIRDYYLQLATDSGFSNVVQTRTSGSSAQTFTGLNPNTTYYLRYRARNDYGSGAYSGTRSAKTLVGVPAAPGTPVASDLAPTSVQLDWAAPSTDGGGTITTYRIQRSTNSSFSAGLVEYTQGNVRTRDFTDLAPSQTYYYRVRAENSAGAGAWSGTLTITTISGVYYSNGTTWLPCGVFVSDGTAWEAGEISVSDGTNWDAAI